MVWPLDDDSEGAKFEIVDIPADCSTRPRRRAPRAARDDRARRRRPAWRSTSATRSSTADEIKARDPHAARSRSSSCRCCAARRSRTRACSPCSTRSSTTCRRRSTSRRPRASTSKGDEPIERKAERERAVRGAGVQDRRRPVRQAHLLPHLLGQAREGLGDLQLDQGPQGAHRPHPAHAREPARGHRRRVRGRHRRGPRLQADDDRRHALRARAPDRARAAWSSPSRSSPSRSSPRPRPTRTSSARRSARSPTRTRRSACTPTRTPARRSSAAWASCTSRCSSTA